jgi:hypothetical protein
VTAPEVGFGDHPLVLLPVAQVKALGYEIAKMLLVKRAATLSVVLGTFLRHFLSALKVHNTPDFRLRYSTSILATKRIRGNDLLCVAFCFFCSTSVR